MPASQIHLFLLVLEAHVDVALTHDFGLVDTTVLLGCPAVLGEVVAAVRLHVKDLVVLNSGVQPGLQHRYHRTLVLVLEGASVEHAVDLCAVLELVHRVLQVG